MFERESALFQFAHGYLLKLVADFSDEDLLTALPGAANPPAYILGHLAICNDSALKILSQPTVCPAVWSVAFGRGSHPSRMKIPFPSRDELLNALEVSHQRILAAAPHADPAAMSQPTKIPFFDGTPIKTAGDVLAHLMTTHFCLHLGQLSLMRRSLGHTPLF